MTRSTRHVPRSSRPPGPARPWYATAGTAALAAIVMLALHTDGEIIAAGLLAAGAAGTALAEARVRSRRPDTTDLASLVLAVLTLATALLALAGIVLADR
jgi:hypothetical protein